MKKKTDNNSKAQLIMVGGVQLSREQRIKTDNNSLTITYARPRDSGIYICCFETVEMNPLKHRLNVQYSPIVRLEGPRERSVRKGTSTTLKCIANGNPEPTITWTKPESPFLPGVINKEVRS